MDVSGWLQPQQFPALYCYADKLRTVYTQSELPIYSNPACYRWTPYPGRKYIDLITFDRKVMQIDECRKAMLYSQTNSITRKGSASTVELKNILQAKPGKKLKCVLVEGPPGIGKSTLAWQMCNRWGKRELFQQYAMVLLLPLRYQRVQEAKCVEDLFISIDKDLQEKVRNEVIRENWDGKDTLIILEGLDELPSHLLSQGSIFTALLSGEALSQATILVTSRPSATDQLHNYWHCRISRHFQLNGFTEENVYKYAESVLSDDKQLSHFKEYVSIHPHIQSILYVPLHCVIAVTVYLQCQQSCTSPPKTLTRLYTCLTQAILTQYLNDHPQYTGEDYTLDTVFDLRVPHSVHCYFKDLCKTAFVHLNNKQLIFSDIPEKLHNLGFTNAVLEYQKCSYNFLHLTVQEFLAAYHISLMSSSEQELLIETKWPQSHLKNMFRFVAGITRLNGLTVRHMHPIGSNEKLSHYFLEVLYECQDMGILDTTYTYKVELHDPSLHHCLAIGYCIANSSCEWNISLQECCNDRQAEVILQGMNENRAYHIHYSKKIIVQCDYCSTDFIYKLFSQIVPNFNNNLEILISHTGGTEIRQISFTGGLRHLIVLGYDKPVLSIFDTASNPWQLIQVIPDDDDI